jgi:hypothetical protein
MAEFDERGRGWSAVALLYKPARKNRLYREGQQSNPRGCNNQKKSHRCKLHLTTDYSRVPVVILMVVFSPRCNHISCAVCGGVCCEKVRKKEFGVVLRL